MGNYPKVLSQELVWPRFSFLKKHTVCSVEDRPPETRVEAGRPDRGLSMVRSGLWLD